MKPLAALSALSSGRRSKWLVIVAWVALALGTLPLQGKLQDRAADESHTFLVRGSESAKAKRLIEERFRSGRESAAVIAYVRDGGITSADRDRMDLDAQRICRARAIPSLKRVATPYGLFCGASDPLDVGGGPGLLISPDSSVSLAVVTLGDDSTPEAETAVAAIRAVTPPPEGDATGLRAYVTGQAGFEADRSAAVAGIDDKLLVVTVAVLLVILLAIYRSPIVAAVPLVVVVLAYLVAAGLTYGLVAAGATTISGQTAAILIVLMFGAGTDYCLLIVARFRDELRRTADVHEAMRRAAARTAPAIVSAGAIVVVAMLVLGLADFNATREMGPILALGVAVMVLAGLTLLPATLTAIGRRAFWPAVPRVEQAPPEASRFWGRVAGAVGRRPAWIAAGTTLVLAAGALGALQERQPMSFADQFRDPPESVHGEEVIRDRFIPGRAAPLNVVTPNDAAEPVIARLTEGTRGPVQEMYLMSRSADGAQQPERASLALSDAFLKLDPFSRAAADAVPGLRARVREAAGPGARVLVGGTIAEAHDTRVALANDARLIVPISLALIALVLAVLLRAVVMPLYVIATVVLSFACALGLGSLAFTHVFGQPSSDPSLPLFAFVFLVALGVDYNVFLLARIREESARRPEREAVTAALERTGGVITSAGLVLAATFAVLMTLDMVAMFQIGFVVALGLLVDTFLVRALLVPAIAVLLGPRNWWPRRRQGF